MSPDLQTALADLGRALTAASREDRTDLERIALLRQLQGLVMGEAMPAAVAEALDHGATWAAVGDSLGGISRQAAQQQWSRRLTMRRLPVQ